MPSCVKRNQFARRTAAAIVALAILTSGGCTTGADDEAELGEGRKFWQRVFSKDTYKLYKPPIHQGNNSLLNDKVIKRLQPGMRRDQVEYLLGSPILSSPFRLNQWNYVYTHAPSRGKTVRRNLTLFFDDNDRLTRICKEDRCRS